MTNFAAKGTLIKKGDGASPEVFTTVAQVVTIGGPSLAQDPIDVTNHSSLEAWKEFVGGLKDGGEVSLEINYDPATPTHNATAGLIKSLEDQTVDNYQIVFSDTANTTWTIPALVTGFETGAPVDGKLSASVTLKVSGKPTLV